MMKVKARFYKGIEFIQISELPAQQQSLLQTSAISPERIKIIIEGKLLDNCLQYKDYSTWHQTFYQQSVAPATNPVPVKQEEILLHIPVDKA